MVVFLILSFFPPQNITAFSCSFSLRSFLDMSSIQTSCSVSLPSGTATAYINSDKQWPCYCTVPKCDRKVFKNARALQMHIRRDATAETLWIVCLAYIM